MTDPILKQFLQPSNMVMITARYPDGRWSITNITLGTKELYPQITYADRHLSSFQNEANRVVRQGAEACEFKILRASFDEIEFICAGNR